MLDNAMHPRASTGPVESLFFYSRSIFRTLVKPALSEFDTELPLFFCFTERTIKQEQETAEEADNRSPALEEIGQTEEEGVALEESMTGSPNNVQDGLSGPNATADAGSQQPSGTDKYISKRR